MNANLMNIQLVQSNIIFDIFEYNNSTTQEEE